MVHLSIFLSPVQNASHSLCSWGCTQPLLKISQDASGQQRRKQTGSRLLSDLYSLFSNWRFSLRKSPFLCDELVELVIYTRPLPSLKAFAVNQLGSVLFTYLLGTAPLSLAVPACNGFAFMFTALSSEFVFECDRKVGRGERIYTLCGCFLVLVGVGLCLY